MIAVAAGAANRVRAYRLAHPEASPGEIARALDIRLVQVKSALSQDRRRRIKSVAS